MMGDGSISTARRDGAVLIVVLWILIVLALLVSTLTFEMQVEANVTSYYRKRFKSQYLAQAGIEWAKMILLSPPNSDEGFEDEYPDLFLQTELLRRGMPVQARRTLGEGEFILDLVPEQGRLNVNRLTERNPDYLYAWQELLDMGRVPDEEWDHLIDAFLDWVDRDDLHRINGAESDDEFYEERGYDVKNAPLDTVDELLLIKGFTPSIVYGGPSEDEDAPAMPGIAQWLTTWGDGRVNVNTATRDVLLTLPEVDEFDVDTILDGRAGVDGEFDTIDDGYVNVGDVQALTGLGRSFAARITTDERTFIRVTSQGEVQGVRSGIWAIFRHDGNDLVPIFWREEQMP